MERKLRSRNHPKKGAFGRVDVLNPLGTGWGALEVAFRYSRVNMNGGVWGSSPENYEVTGNLQDFTVGLNWYLFPNVRMMANYVHSEDKNEPGGQSQYNIFQARAQIDF